VTLPVASSSKAFLSAVQLAVSEPRFLDFAFEAITGDVPWPKAYGGDLLAQACTAAVATVDDGKTLHSMHSYFLRPADVGQPLRYEVENVRNGRGYSTRQVRAYQHGKELFRGLASFHLQEEGDEFAPPVPSYPSPETLPTAADYLAVTPEAGHLDPEVARYWGAERSFDIRHVPTPIYVATEATPASRQAVWLRSFDRLPDDPGIHAAALAYVSDYTILEPTMRALEMSWSDPGLVTASLDNSIWFHRQARVDEWLLYVQEAVTAQHSRGLNFGRFFDREGRLIATIAQEGMLRKGP
jgi:acyl-CoA thioesterase-2